MGRKCGMTKKAEAETSCDGRDVLCFNCCSTSVNSWSRDVVF